ncbi:MAG: alpha/beta fold hydrolase [Pseudomonadota bacterium]
MRCQSFFHPCTGARPGAAGHLVLLPGWGMSAAVFADILPALCAHAHVTTIDLPGFGANAHLRASALEEMAALAADAAPLHAAWFGWSLGGMVAACVAVNEPQRVQALMTAGTNLSFIQRTGWMHAMAPDTFAAFEREVATDSVAAFDRFLALQCQGAGRDDLRRLRQVAAASPSVTREALLDGLHALRTADLRPASADLRCPSLWLYGERDALVPVAVAETVARRLPAARVQVLPETAHVPFFSAAGRLVAGLDSFPEWRT